MRADNI